MTCVEDKENMLSFHLQHFSKKHKPLSPFVSKLRFLLNSTKYHHAIHWGHDGRAIVITDIDSFKRSVLENEEEMFKTRNFTSFVRQLNLYGFRKIPSNGKSDPMSNMKFEHLHFRRDRPDLMYLVHRTCLATKKRFDHSSILSGQKALAGKFQPLCTNIKGEIPSTHVKLTIPPKFMQDHKSSRLPLGISVLQNLKKKHEQNFTIIHDNSNQSFDDSFIESSSLENSTCEFDDESSNSHDEHDYALPGFNGPKIDEKATFEFLNDTFNAEIDAVKTLLSIKDYKPKLELNLHALSTLAEVSLKFSTTPTCFKEDGDACIRSQSIATPMETLNQN